MASGSASHNRVDPSTSVNRNVTVPDGRAPMNYLQLTPQLSHTPIGPTGKPRDPAAESVRGQTKGDRWEVRIGGVAALGQWGRSVSAARSRRARMVMILRSIVGFWAKSDVNSALDNT